MVCFVVVSKAKLYRFVLWSAPARWILVHVSANWYTVYVHNYLLQCWFGIIIILESETTRKQTTGIERSQNLMSRNTSNPLVWCYTVIDKLSDVHTSIQNTTLQEMPNTNTWTRFNNLQYPKLYRGVCQVKYTVHTRFY